MALNLTAQQMLDSAIEVPVFAQPDSASRKIGIAAATIAVRDPAVVKNGFLEVLFPSGSAGYIAQAKLKRWEPAAGTSGRCIPAQLSNGRLGFDYKN